MPYVNEMGKWQPFLWLNAQNPMGLGSPGWVCRRRRRLVLAKAIIRKGKEACDRLQRHPLIDRFLPGLAPPRCSTLFAEGNLLLVISPSGEIQPLSSHYSFGIRQFFADKLLSNIPLSRDACQVGKIGIKSLIYYDY